MNTSDVTHVVYDRERNVSASSSTASVLTEREPWFHDLLRVKTVHGSHGLRRRTENYRNASRKGITAEVHPDVQLCLRSVGDSTLYVVEGPADVPAGPSTGREGVRPA
ncbi:hypothetical protein GCM10027184_08920 [Saccharothrix stipae]